MTVATITDCAAYYTLDGNKQVTCMPDGNWSGGLGQCVPAPDTCKKWNRTDVIHSTNPIRPMTLAIIKDCGAFQEIEGNNETTCQADGNWSVELGSCVPAPDSCRKFTRPNVIHSTNPIRPMTVARIEECADFQVIEGNKETTCQPDGGWSVQLGRCVPARDTCTKFTKPAVIYSQKPIRPKTVAKIERCPLHQVIEGNRVATCQANGTWNAELGSCVSTTDTCRKFANSAVVYSKNPIQPKTVARIEKCPPHQVIEGNRAATCQTNKKWSVEIGRCVPAPDTCKKFTRPDVTHSTNPIRPMTVARIKGCATHEIIEGNEKTTCQASGNWSVTLGHCMPAADTCTQFTRPEVIHSTNPIRPMTVARIKQCADHEITEGNNETICQADGTWSVELGQCVLAKDTCARFADPVVTYSEDPIRPHTIAKIGGCPIFFVGQHEVTCQTSGTWSDNIGHCIDPDDFSYDPDYDAEGSGL
ncbi:hypothetical protein AB6A40_001689 [Gnathostoma spinigerum]|uniref:Sushi domain-containing protein n=1 Tax=Gnathostoma spinigerum TaxID=75299 RepID=A0ABD6E5R9_9BILA